MPAPLLHRLCIHRHPPRQTRVGSSGSRCCTDGHSRAFLSPAQQHDGQRSLCLSPAQRVGQEILQAVRVQHAVNDEQLADLLEDAELGRLVEVHDLLQQVGLDGVGGDVEVVVEVREHDHHHLAVEAVGDAAVAGDRVPKVFDAEGAFEAAREEAACSAACVTG